MPMTGEQKTQRPGVVLGPDGKPCKPCTAFRNWRTSKTTHYQPNVGANTSEPANTSKAPPTNEVLDSIAISQAIPPLAEPMQPDYCPPDSEHLGRATWTFLHTTAAYYPEKPSPLQMRHMHSLLSALPKLYPCGYCAEHLGEVMKDHPPDVSGRAAVSQWLCQRHNEVNERLGKKLFDCNKTDERWKDGPPDGSCD